MDFPNNLFKILAIMAFVYYLYTEGKKKQISSLGSNNEGLNGWINTGYGYGYGEMNPAEALPELIKKFGKPTIFDSKTNGHAIWEKSVLNKTPYEKIMIRDQQIPHDKPTKHTDFLYSWYRLDIPNDKIKALYHIFDNISYDSSKNIMIARSDNMRSNLVTHWIAKKYADGKLTIDEVNGLIGPMMIELSENDPTNSKYLQLESEL